MTDVTADQQRAALEWQAEEHQAQQRVEERVAALGADAAQPAGAPQQSEQQQQAAALVQIVQAQLPRVCAVLWGVVDAAAVKYAGPEYRQTAEERQQLAEATAPVVAKYLAAADMGWLATTQEGALVLTAAVIYGAKVFSAQQAKPTAPVPAQVEATA